MLLDGPRPLAKHDKFVSETAQALVDRAASSADIALLCARIEVEARDALPAAMKRRAEAQKVIKMVKKGSAQ